MIAAVFADLLAKFLWICVELVGAASVVGFSMTWPLLCRLDVLTAHTGVALLGVAERPRSVVQSIGGQFCALSVLLPILTKIEPHPMRERFGHFALPEPRRIRIFYPLGSPSGQRSQIVQDRFFRGSH